MSGGIFRNFWEIVIRGRQAPTKMVNVPIGDLATIWLKYNQPELSSVQSAPPEPERPKEEVPVKEEKPEQTTPSTTGASDQIQTVTMEFYQETIQPYPGGVGTA